MLDHDVRRWDHHVDKARVIEHDRLLKYKQIGRVRHSIDTVQELHPKLLALALLVAAPLPLRRERLCLRSLCRTLYHTDTSSVCSLLYFIAKNSAQISTFML